MTRKIAHNTIIQIAGKAVSTTIALVVASIMFRYLGREGYGNFTTAVVFLQFFGIVVDMGLYIILITKISEPDADTNSLVSNIFTIRLISAIIFLGIAPLLVLLFPYPTIVKMGVAIVSLSFLFITLNQVLMGVFQKNLRMNRVTIAEVAGRLVLLVGTYLAIHFEQSLATIFTIVVLGSFTNFLLTFLLVRKFVRIRLRFDFPLWKKIMKDAYPIALAILFNLVYFKADTLILSLLKPQEHVGIYGAPYKILEVLTTFPAMFAGLAIPVLTAAYAAQDMERFKRVLRKAFDFLALVAIPMSVGTYFIAKPVMLFIAGDEFSASIRVLQILIVATSIIFMGNLFGHTIVVIKKQKQILWAYAAIAVISVIGYLILIPKYSYIGAASMTVVSELLITIAAAFVVYRAVKVGPSFVLFGKAIIASAVMGVVLYFMQGYNFVLMMAAGTVVYLGILLLLRGFNKEIIREIIALKS